MTTRAQVCFLDGISFGEAPRWHEGSLYLSDIHADRVLRVDRPGAYEVVARLPGPVSGLGWLPDGRMLMVSMHDRKVLRRELSGELMEHADLSAIATWHANDMIVAADGTAYVGNFGFQISPVRAEPRSAALARISPLGAVSVAAEGLWFPNGMVITPDGRTLVVAESAAHRLSAFDIEGDGVLSNQRVWAGLSATQVPDGICLDAEGAIWVALPTSREVVRLREGGTILDRVMVEQQAIACMLGGANRTTLFIMTAESRDPDWCRDHHTARIMSLEVEVPGCGLP